MKFKRFSIIAIAIASVFVFTGCGSSSSDSSGDGDVIGTSGIAVDPYIEGAKFYIDTNKNGSFDTGEPLSGPSDPTGVYNFSVSMKSGDVVRMHPDYKGKHNGVAYDGELLERIVNDQITTDGKIVTSPITTLASRESLTADQVAEIINTAFGTGFVTSADIYANPMADISGSSITDENLKKLKAGITINGLLEVVNANTTIKNAISLLPAADKTTIIGNMLKPMADSINTVLSEKRLSDLSTGLTNASLPEMDMNTLIKTAVSINNQIVGTLKTTIGSINDYSNLGTEFGNALAGIAQQIQVNSTKVAFANYIADNYDTLSADPATLTAVKTVATSTVQLVEPAFDGTLFDSISSSDYVAEIGEDGTTSISEDTLFTEYDISGRKLTVNSRVDSEHDPMPNQPVNEFIYFNEDGTYIDLLEQNDGDAVEISEGTWNVTNNILYIKESGSSNDWDIKIYNIVFDNGNPHYADVMENGVATEQKWYFFGANSISSDDFSGKVFYEVQSDGTMPSTIDGNFIIGFSASNANAFNFEQEAAVVELSLDNGDWRIEDRQLKLRGLDEYLQPTQYTTTLIPMYKGDDTSTYHYEFATIDYTGSTVDDLSTTYFKELKDIYENITPDIISGEADDSSKKYTVTSGVFSGGWTQFNKIGTFINESSETGEWEIVTFGSYGIIKLEYTNETIEYIIIHGSQTKGITHVTLIDDEHGIIVTNPVSVE